VPEFDVVLLDLDGTVTDPAEGITKSLAHALTALGRPVPSPEVLVGYIGPPLLETFALNGVPEAEGRRAIEHYRERFADVGLYENEVYEDIPELLDALKGAARTVGLATSKPHVYAERILEHFGLLRWFDVVGGSELDLSRIEKHDVIDWALAQLGEPDRSTVVMVGDRRHDVEGAKTCGVGSIAVTWGFGSVEELVASEPDHIVGSVAELRDLLLRS
jgi:phosphoglycolate phosphatase